ncbi:MAG TPA: STM4015 family protein [Planctomycetota bacterium]|jgi:hypothetical protein
MESLEHLTTFAGFPVKDFDPKQELTDPASVIYRLGLLYDSDPERFKSGCLIGIFRELFRGRRLKPVGNSWTQLLENFLSKPGSSEAPGLIVGSWVGCSTFDGTDTSVEIVKALVAAKARLPKQKALFIGDITQEENEISWIQQSDLAPVLQAYPHLEHLQIRGGNDLSLGEPLKHTGLRTLILQSGGLPKEVVRQVALADLPNLEHLELWLGTDDYGGDSTIADLTPLFAQDRLPKLKYLGLRDCEYADEVARAISSSPLLERVEALDLSLGTLGDDGARALLDAPATRRLKTLDLHHHYVASGLLSKLRQLGIQVIADDARRPDGEDRYVAVSE